MDPTTARGVGNVIILASFNMINVPCGSRLCRLGGKMVPGCSRSAVIADTVYSAALETPFISTSRSRPLYRRIRFPPHLARAANVWFKPEHGSPDSCAT